MKHVLEKWSGQYLIDHEVKDSLKDEKFKDKQEFKVKLLARRRNDGKSGR